MSNIMVRAACGLPSRAFLLHVLCFKRVTPVVAWLASASFVPGASVAEKFPADIQPLLSQYCLNCHSTAKHKGDLDLERFKSFEEVARQLVRAIRCTLARGLALANAVHHLGSAIVYEGHLERCEAVAEVLEEIGLKTRVEN